MVLARCLSGGRRARQGDLAAKRHLASLLADARGIPLKIGQVLAGASSTGPYAAVIEEVDPLPAEVMVATLEESWRAPLETVLEFFDPVGKAASLGQVHRARLLDGRDVAIKIQYPGIREAVAAEVKILGLVPRVGPARRWGVDLDGYKQMFADDLEAELDYQGEAGRQRAFAADVRVRGLEVPGTIDGLCTPRVLVQEWAEGVPLREAVTWSKSERARLGCILLETFLRSAFLVGTVHADPNPGNVLYARTAEGPVVRLLDFGSVVVLGPRQRLALLRLIFDLRRGQTNTLLGTWAALGFDAGKLEHLLPQLTRLSLAVLRPLVETGRFALGSWNLREELDTLLGDQKWWFRSAGPPGLLLALRALQGLVGQLEAMGVDLPWGRMLDNVVPPVLRENALAWAPLELPAHRHERPPSLAQALRVEVRDGDRVVISMEMPATATADLPDLVPEEVHEALRRRGIDVGGLARRAIEGGLRPGSLFESHEGDRRLRVWLS